MPSRASSDGWLEFFDPHKHQFYYYNQQTQVMSWDPPTSLAQQGGAGYTSGYATASAGRSLQPIGEGGGGGGFDGIDGEPSTTFTTKTFESIDSDVGLGGGTCSGGGVGGYGGHDGGGGHGNRGESSAQLWSAPPGASGGAGGVGGMGSMGEEVPFHLVGPLLVGHEVGIIMDSTSDQRGAAGEHVDVQRGTVLGFDALSGRHKVHLGGEGEGEGASRRGGGSGGGDNEGKRGEGKNGGASVTWIDLRQTTFIVFQQELYSTGPAAATLQGRCVLVERQLSLMGDLRSTTPTPPPLTAAALRAQQWAIPLASSKLKLTSATSFSLAAATTYTAQLGATQTGGGGGNIVWTRGIILDHRGDGDAGEFLVDLGDVEGGQQEGGAGGGEWMDLKARACLVLADDVTDAGFVPVPVTKPTENVEREGQVREVRGANHTVSAAHDGGRG